ncbi:hypothetical protein BTVI_105355 [Pitangus sulphuratus]|nr:hypothetical protein BTVI_105355 [Pitangus sulphuratus]
MIITLVNVASLQESPTRVIEKFLDATQKLALVLVETVRHNLRRAFDWEDSPGLFNIFINDLDAGLEGIVRKFANDTNLGGAADFFKDREALQGDLNKLEGWEITNHMKFIKGKCQILLLEWRNFGCVYRLGNEELESSAMGRDLGVSWSTAS